MFYRTSWRFVTRDFRELLNYITLSPEPLKSIVLFESMNPEKAITLIEPTGTEGLSLLSNYGRLLQ